MYDTIGSRSECTCRVIACDIVKRSAKVVTKRRSNLRIDPKRKRQKSALQIGQIYATTSLLVTSLRFYSNNDTGHVHFVERRTRFVVVFATLVEIVDVANASCEPRTAGVGFGVGVGAIAAGSRPTAYVVFARTG